MEHTPIPWKVRESGACVCSNSKTICQLVDIEDGPLKITPEVEANAKRIIHCVNNFDDVTKQRDDLLEACKNIVDRMGVSLFNEDGETPDFHQLEQAITNAEAK